MNPFHLLLLLVLIPLAQAVAAPLKIGVLLKDRNLFWASAEKGATAAGRAAGVEPIIKAPSVPNSLSQQLALLSALSKEKLDALVIAPLSTDEFKEPLAGLVARGVKIVALDTKLPDGVANVYIGYNQAAMAEAAARFIAETFPNGESISILRATSLEGVSLREKTLVAALKRLCGKSTQYNDVIAGSERDDDYDKCIVLLDRHPDAKVICTPFSSTSMAMIKAIKDKHLDGKIFHVGFGTSLPAPVVESMESGTMRGWIAQQPKLIGSKGVEAAIDLVKGRPVVLTMDVPYYVVTPANLHEPQIQALRE